MKKIFAFVLVLAMIFAFAACGDKPGTESASQSESAPETTSKPDETKPEDTKGEDNPPVAEDKVLTHAEYIAAKDEDPVVIEAYVQGKQTYSPQYNNTCLYLQDNDGGYFVYRWSCTQEEYDGVAVGAKVRVTGFKGSWSGEQEIKDAKVEVIEGSYIAEPLDVTELLGTDELIKYQNCSVVFKGMRIEAYNDDGDAFAFKAEDGSDIYYKVSVNGAIYDFCIESDLCGADTEVYQFIKTLKVGDKVDIAGFLYWYNGPNPHTTAITKITSYADYEEAKDEDPVVIEAFVQDKQIYSAQYGNTSLYLQDEDGAYFVYRWACTQEEYDRVAVGAKVRVTGYKGSWSGEQEITDAKVEIIYGTYVAEPLDVTALLGTEKLIHYQNRYVSFRGMKVEKYNDAGDAFAFKSENGSDIYFKVSKNGVTYNFCVESDLRGAGSDVYELVKTLKVGDEIDIVCFLYWYNGPNPHTVEVKK